MNKRNIQIYDLVTFQYPNLKVNIMYNYIYNFSNIRYIRQMEIFDITDKEIKLKILSFKHNVNFIDLTSKPEFKLVYFNNNVAKVGDIISINRKHIDYLKIIEDTKYYKKLVESILILKFINN